MKSIILVAIFLAVAFAQNSCYYTTTDGTAYDLSRISYESNWLNGTDSDSNVWYFQICNRYIWGETSPCAMNSSVCVSMNGEVPSNRGSSYSALISDSPYGSSSGVEVLYGSEDICPTAKESTQIKTVIDFVCTTDLTPVVSVSTSDDCYTTITVNSADACPTTYMSGEVLDGDWGDDEDVEEVHTGILPFTFGIFLLVSIVFTCMCCCCVARRRRCQRNKEIARKQFSSVAFQPIPQTNTSVRPSVNIPMQTMNQAHVPAYNPYVVQPQFMYYYPSQVQPQAFVQVQNDAGKVQLDSDEKLAKQLQAQFDQENQV